MVRAGTRARARPDPLVHIETTVRTTEQAEALMDAVLSNRLAACAQVLPIRSKYWWQGMLETEEERLVVFKTTKRQSAAAQERILARHPYEVPYLRVDVMRGVPRPYQEWARAETRTRGRRAR